MNAFNKAMAAYAASAAPIRSERDTEYDVFMRVTNQLRQSDPVADHPGFVHALHQNRQLWTLLAVDVADKQNALDDSLRAQILYLAEFTRLHTSKVLAGKDNHLALVDINTSIMGGLHRQGAAA